jgi:hypothetical protein
MGTIFKIVGTIWALIGILNLVEMDWAHLSSAISTFGLMFNVLLFVLPGIIVIALGELVIKRHSTKDDQ